MRVFTKLYDKAISWSKHPKAPWYLAVLSFAESSFFPIPPDVMLMPMALSQPEKAYRFAFIATMGSLIGGIFGYLIGYWMLDAVLPILESMNYLDKYHQVENFFSDYGFWVVFLAGFSPIPYKLFTIASGAMHLAILPFIIASFVGRGGRFFLVAYLMKKGGEKYEAQIRRSVDYLGYGTIVLVLGYLLIKHFYS